MELVPRPEVTITRLVIAVDYGTTHTGVAWATPAGNRASLSEIEVIEEWGPQMRNQHKIPSVVSYTKKSERRERQFGADLSEDAIAMVHTKLQLDVRKTSTELDYILEALDGVHNLSFQYIKKPEGLPKHTHKGPENIVAEYLERAFQHIIESKSKALKAFAPELRKQTPVDIVVTIPAEWNYKAKNSTFRALTKAGFNNTDDSFPRLGKMLLVTEPEAAAVYTARYLKQTLGSGFRMRVGEGFVLCDAGGGTVDVVSYRVRQLEPFEIERVGIPVGEKCGSIFINLAFKKWLRGLIGSERYRQLDPTKLSNKISSRDAEGGMMRTLMSKFEAKKKAFKWGEVRAMHIDLPESFHDVTVDDRVKECQITISYKDMQSFFEPCATGILRLIQDQLDDIEKRGTRPRNVFLVGGFAESPYLKALIKDALETIPGPVPVELRVPDTSLTAVVRGAVIFGIEKAADETSPTMSQSPRSYGVLVKKPYSKAEHDPRDLTPNDVLKMDMAEQLQWLIKKGDLILSNEIMEVSIAFERHLTQAGPKAGSVAIFAYDYEDEPTSFSRFRNEPGLIQRDVLEYDLSSYPLSQHRRSDANSQVYIASLVLKMRIAPRFLQVQLCLQASGQVVSTKRIADPLLDNIACPALTESRMNDNEESDEDSSSVSALSTTY